VADVAADGGATHGSDRAATRQDGTANGTDPGANGRVLTLPRHSGTSTQAKDHYCAYYADCQSLHRSHGVTSYSNSVFRYCLLHRCD
jgi:hypothetical protein